MDLIISDDLAIYADVKKQVADQARAEVRAARKAAYEAETDPMAGRVLRGEITLETYTAAVDAIRARLPMPEDE